MYSTALGRANRVISRIMGVIDCKCTLKSNDAINFPLIWCLLKPKNYSPFNTLALIF